MKLTAYVLNKYATHCVYAVNFRIADKENEDIALGNDAPKKAGEGREER
jgi:hypothetical protein